jgi:putative chitinase
MTVTVSIEQISGLAPHILPPYRDAFSRGQAVLERYGISATPLRVAHFVAQTLHESGACTLLFEDLDYSAERLPVVWPKRFLPGGPLDPQQYAYRPQRLANEVYGGRMGNLHPGDGYAYRGRGLLQLSGRAGYAEVTSQLRKSEPGAPDFVLDPDAVTVAEWCLQVAAAAWVGRGCDAPADRDDVTEVTRRINNGSTGLAERERWTARTRLVWCRAPATPG